MDLLEKSGQGEDIHGLCRNDANKCIYHVGFVHVSTLHFGVLTRKNPRWVILVCDDRLCTVISKVGR